jgi:DNA-binding PadR family transcriptional regulator
MSRRPNPAEFLPLKPDVFDILLALLDGDAHGYKLIKAASARDGRKGQLQPGALYRLLKQLLDRGLVDEVNPPRGEDGDARRRFYRITPFGRDVVRAEGERLAAVLGTLRRYRLAPSREK